MSLSARSIALGGVGFGARATALHGFTPVTVGPPIEVFPVDRFPRNWIALADERGWTVDRPDRNWST